MNETLTFFKIVSLSFNILILARRDQGGGLALPETCWGFCQSRYDAKKPEIGDEDSASLKTYLDAPRMYD